MPMYEFKCRKCGNHDSVVRPMAESEKLHTCPKCGYVMFRDWAAEQGGRGHAEAATFYSDSLGVHPSQVEEARKRFPNRTFLDDGRMAIKDYQEYKAVLKEIGFVDRN